MNEIKLNRVQQRFGEHADASRKLLTRAMEIRNRNDDEGQMWALVSDVNKQVQKNFFNQDIRGEIHFQKYFNSSFLETKAKLEAPQPGDGTFHVREAAEETAADRDQGIVKGMPDFTGDADNASNCVTWSDFDMNANCTKESLFRAFGPSFTCVFDASR